MDRIAETARAVYERAAAPSYLSYALFASEAAIFERHADAIAGRAVLDLGVGSGRTTAAIAALAGRYIGLDFSQRMVTHCAERFPDQAICQGDARDLSRFTNASFDFVLFSFNGIDTVNEAGRAQIFREVHRVLVPGGWFCFSSHNLDRVGQGAAFSPGARDWRKLRDPATWLHIAKRVPVRLYRYWTYRRQQVRTPHYAILNDPTFDFALLNYYVTEPEQRRQLATVGFIDVEVDPEESVDSLYYTARRAAG